MSNPPDELRDRLLDAALVHVPFEGWSEATFRAAVRDAGVSRDEARMALPRGPVDLATAYHRRGDERMVERMRSGELDEMRFRDKVAAAVRYRIEAIDDREASRRSATLFALPQHAAEGARMIWDTVDRIWTTLGDTSDDANWYTKRATLAGVYASTLLYWLGDDSLNHQDTWAFLDRRIDDVMRIEKLKGAVNANALLRPLMIGPNWLMKQIKPPIHARSDLPGGEPAGPPGE
jgi:ubiquinone biosynthesis protein COQ9